MHAPVTDVVLLSQAGSACTLRTSHISGTHASRKACPCSLHGLYT